MKLLSRNTMKCNSTKVIRDFKFLVILYRDQANAASSDVSVVFFMQ
jgi:hypothetical protein